MSHSLYYSGLFQSLSGYIIQVSAGYCVENFFFEQLLIIGYGRLVPLDK